MKIHTNTIELARKLLVILEASSRMMTSRQLTDTAGMKIPEGKREVAAVRQTMVALKKAGIVSVSGDGKFLYNIIKTDYNRENPFKGSTGKFDHVDSLKITGKTYDHKDALKAIGCQWDSIQSAWFAPNEAKRAEAQSVVDGVAVTVATTEETTTTTEPAKMVESSEVEKLLARIAQLEEDAKEGYETLVVKTTTGEILGEIKGTRPETFTKVLQLAVCRRNIMLVGPAGCGKTHLAKMVADAMGLEFGALGCSASMSEVALYGRSVPNIATGENVFQTTEFLKCYEEGGVFLLDEVDAADANVLLSLNMALANGRCAVPNRSEKPVAHMHKDFVMIATANTFGRGATRVYAGRNQLDGATLDRFAIGTIECYYDSKVEASLCPNAELRSVLTAVRNRIETSGVRRIMSTRFMKDAFVMTSQAGWSIADVMGAFFQGWTTEEKSKVA